jgi:hypothetical protein
MMNDAFHDGLTPSAPIPELVSEVYREAPVPLRAKLLEVLLRPVGPLALAVLSAGAFGDMLWRDATAVSFDDATRIGADQVLDLARFVEQASPDSLLAAGSLVADNPFGVATVSGAALLIALAAWRRNRAQNG